MTFAARLISFAYNEWEAVDRHGSLSIFLSLNLHPLHFPPPKIPRFVFYFCLRIAFQFAND